MIKCVFSAVAGSRLWISRKTGMTYNEVNVLLYYFLIPLSWAVMFDCWLRLPIITPLFLCVWIGIYIATRHFFRDWCDWTFQDSALFLNWFNRFGGNYYLNSVVICVILPLLIYSLLSYLLIS